MTDSIYLLQPDGSLAEVSQAPYLHERDLQDLLDQYPELLPGVQIDPENPRRWLLLRSEAGVPSEEGGSDWWAVDHLLVDQDGIPTFVEVKRSSDTRIRREVVAQMLEYAANGTAYWKMESLRGWFEELERRAGRDPQERLRGFVGDTGLEAEVFWQRVQENLQTGRVRCVFVADEIPLTLHRLVEFLNEHLDTVEVLAVELPQYVANDHDLKALVPRLVGQTGRARAVKGAPVRPARRWDEASFMATVSERSGPEDVAVCQDVLSWCHRHVDRVVWGQGRQDGSMRAVVESASGEQVPFMLWTYGKVEVELEYLANRPPFAERPLRRELLDRINAIGVDLPEHSLDRRPAFPFERLRSEEHREQFLSAMEWAVSMIRGEAQGPARSG